MGGLTKKGWIILSVVIAAAGTAIILYDGAEKEPTIENNLPIVGQQMETNELKITDAVVGTGAEAKPGNTVTVHYTGTFANGSKFDSSVDRGEPFSFILGAGNVIEGWDRGVAGMKVGGKRTLIIPPEMGYGPNDYGPIPGGSTLFFEVELLGVQ